MERALLVLALVALVAVLALALRRRPGPGARSPAAVDPAELGLAGTGRLGVVGFSSPQCLACERWELALHEAEIPFAKVDVSECGDLARRYGVTVTPLVLAVDLTDGRVVETYEGEPRPEQVDHLTRMVAEA